MRDPAFEKAVQGWETLHRSATREEAAALRFHAEDLDQRMEELCGFVRSTYVDGKPA